MNPIFWTHLQDSGILLTSQSPKMADIHFSTSRAHVNYWNTPIPTTYGYQYEDDDTPRRKSDLEAPSEADDKKDDEINEAVEKVYFKTDSGFYEYPRSFVTKAFSRTSKADVDKSTVGNGDQQEQLCDHCRLIDFEKVTKITGKRASSCDGQIIANLSKQQRGEASMTALFAILWGAFLEQEPLSHCTPFTFLRLT